MKYYVQEIDDMYEVIEKTTDIKVLTGIGKRKATGLCKNLNLGGGFDGMTPDFFVSFRNKRWE